MSSPFVYRTVEPQYHAATPTMEGLLSFMMALILQSECALMGLPIAIIKSDVTICETRHKPENLCPRGKCVITEPLEGAEEVVKY